MTIIDSQRNLQNLLDACVQRGNLNPVFLNTNEVMTMQASLNFLIENANKAVKLQSDLNNLKTQDNGTNKVSE